MFRNKEVSKENVTLQKTIQELEHMQGNLVKSLERSETSEAEMKLLIESQQEKIIALETELVKEKDQKQCLQEILEGSMDELSRNSSCRAIEMEDDLKQTFGTNSTVLMQYKYLCSLKIFNILSLILYFKGTMNSVKQINVVFKLISRKMKH